MTIHRAYNKKEKEIKTRLQDFKKVKGDDIFYELCFCLLTPQSKAYSCEAAVRELQKRNFIISSFNPENILQTKTRFHKTKARYLLQAKEDFGKIKENLKEDAFETREWLVKSVKGLGYKEAAHFLRNIGYENLAILDRYILRQLAQRKVIKEMPKTLSKKMYLDIERKFKDYAKRVNIPMDELDLLFWSEGTGKIFK